MILEETARSKAPAGSVEHKVGDLYASYMDTVTVEKLGITPQVLPRSPGSWPGYRFTNPPLSLPAGGFGLGHGTGAHAPDEYYLIESTNPKVEGLDGAVRSFVEYLYAIA